MRKLAAASVVALALAGCESLEEGTEAFPVTVHGLAQTLAVPGQPLLVMGENFADDGSVHAFVDGQTARVLAVDPFWVAVEGPGAAGNHAVELQVTHAAASDDEEGGTETDTFDAGSVLVVAELAPLSPATQPGAGAWVGWYSLPGGELGGALDSPLGTALVGSLRFGPAAPPATPPFLGTISVPYALVFRAVVDGNGGPIPSSTEDTRIYVDGMESAGQLPGGEHELEVRVLVPTALSDIELNLAPPGSMTIPYDV